MSRAIKAGWAQALGLALCVGLIYAALLAFFIPMNGLWSGDQGAKLVQVFSLLGNRLRSAALLYPAQDVDPTGAFSPLPALFAVREGESYYSIFSYPHAVPSAIFFFLLGYPGLYVIPVCATVGSTLLLALIGRRLGLARWWLLVPLAGLATPLSFYALVFWEHALAVCCALAATLAALDAYERDSPRLALLAGLLGGLGYWMRAELLWLAPALLAGLLWARAGSRVSIAAGVGFVALILLSLLVNGLWFGQPLGPQVAINYAPATNERLFTERRQLAAGMLLGPASRQLLPALGLGLVVAAAALPAARSWLLAAYGSLVLTMLLMNGIVLQTGLAAVAPFTLAGLCAAQSWRRPLVRLLLGTAGIFLLGVLLTAPNDGGAQWSTRYLLVSAALLTPLGVLTTLSGGTRAPRVALALLLAAGLTATVYGVLLLKRSATDSLRIVQVVNAQPEPVVLTDVWYGPQLLAPLFLERELLFMDGVARRDEARALLQEAGIKRFSYVTAQPWRRDTALPAESGLRCERIEGFAYGLTLLSCAVEAMP